MQQKNEVIVWCCKPYHPAKFLAKNLLNFLNKEAKVATDLVEECDHCADIIEELRKKYARLSKTNKELEGSITETTWLIMDTFIEDKTIPPLRQLTDDYTCLRQRYLEAVRENSALKFKLMLIETVAMLRQTHNRGII